MKPLTFQQLTYLIIKSELTLSISADTPANQGMQSILSQLLEGKSLMEWKSLPPAEKEAFASQCLRTLEDDAPPALTKRNLKYGLTAAIMFTLSTLTASGLATLFVSILS